MAETETVRKKVHFSPASNTSEGVIIDHTINTNKSNDTDTKNNRIITNGEETALKHKKYFGSAKRIQNFEDIKLSDLLPGKDISSLGATDANCIKKYICDVTSAFGENSSHIVVAKSNYVVIKTCISGENTKLTYSLLEKLVNIFNILFRDFKIKLAENEKDIIFTITFFKESTKSTDRVKKVYQPKDPIAFVNTEEDDDTMDMDETEKSWLRESHNLMAFCEPLTSATLHRQVSYSNDSIRVIYSGFKKIHNSFLNCYIHKMGTLAQVSISFKHPFFMSVLIKARVSRNNYTRNTSRTSDRFSNKRSRIEYDAPDNDEDDNKDLHHRSYKKRKYDTHTDTSNHSKPRNLLSRIFWFI